MIKVLLVIAEGTLAYFAGRALFTVPAEDIVAISVGVIVLAVLATSIGERLYRL